MMSKKNQEETFLIRRVKSKEELSVVSQLADSIWPGVYATILSPSQMDYMMTMMYDPQVLHREHQSGIAYFIAYYGDRAVGYFSVEADPETQTGKLHKMYLAADVRGKGCGHKMMEAAVAWAGEEKLKLLKLNVNQNNTKAIEFYKSCGWKILYPEKIDIGGGFSQDDYIMGFDL